MQNQLHPHVSFEFQVIVNIRGQRYATALLAIRRTHVVTKFGRVRFAQVEGYRLNGATR